MPAPTAPSELRILSDLLTQLEDPDTAMRRLQRLRNRLRAAGLLLLVTAFALALAEGGYLLMLAVLAGAGGIAAGIASLLGEQLQQWPLTCQYIDLERVRQRLAELEDGS